MVKGSRLAALAIAAFALAACASKKDAYVDRPVEDLYNSAMDELNDSDYTKAVKDFDEVDRQHPYSVWATKAQLMSCYTLYQQGKYADSIIAADRFIQLHPGHRDVAYAYYLKALDYYIQIADVGRDQRTTQQALGALAEVARRFPDTKYARDARLKMDLARDHLAGKEMEIGRWYERQGDFLGAVNRFKRVVDDYQTTTHVPEALERLTECYLALGLVDEARRTTAVLGFNYPGSPWYVDTYGLVTNGGPNEPVAAPKGWLGRMVSSIF
ncbi:MAG TPA: outer membrane protein assembly factor BamD [Stellaceae bacterium]|nr:outer membrane protein assembly factor BamD [Stellaceae bacterium]